MSTFKSSHVVVVTSITESVVDWSLSETKEKHAFSHFPFACSIDLWKGYFKKT